VDINKILNENPSLIARVSEEAEDKRVEWQRAKEIYANKEALYVMGLKANLDTLKATEVKYYINSNDELYTLRLELVVLESGYRKREVTFNGLKEQLNAAKVLARIQMTDKQTIDWAGNIK